MLMHMVTVLVRRLIVLMSPKEHRRLVAAARKIGVSVGEYVRRAIAKEMGE
jgi:predicted HicB family RNase H-like nuclease